MELIIWREDLNVSQFGQLRIDGPRFLAWDFNAILLPKDRRSQYGFNLNGTSELPLLADNLHFS